MNDQRQLYAQVLRRGRQFHPKASRRASIMPQFAIILAVVAIIVLVLGVWLSEAHSAPVSPVMAQREAILRVARAEIGRGESFGDNQGPDVLRYTHGRPVAWCAGFASYVLTRAGLIQPHTLSAKDLYRQFKKKRRIVSIPRPGDLMFFWRESPASWKGHVEIVEKVDADTITTIAGNVGKYPAKVKRIVYKRKAIPRLLGFGKVV